MMFTNNSTPIPASRCGLYASGATVMRNGSAYTGIGVNHVDIFWKMLNDNMGEYQADLNAIASRKIPFVRFSVTPYSAADIYNKWYLDQATFFQKLDLLVNYAQQVSVGLVFSLTWSLRDFTNVCYWVGGYQPLKNLAYPFTKAWQLWSIFVSQVVSRYANSASVFMWEIGNELAASGGAEYYSSWALDGTYAAWLNWGTAPHGGNYAVTDKMSMAEYQMFSRRAVALIYANDPHRRLISSGNAVGNSFAVTAQSSNSTAADTLAQWSGVASTDSIPWINYRDYQYPVINMHTYPQATNNIIFFNGSEKTQAELIALSKGWADTAGKPFFLGEWGATYWGDTVDQTSTNLSTETANYNAGLNAILINNVQISALWNYDGDLSGSSNWQRWKLNTSERSYQLDGIETANRSLRNQFTQ